MKIGFYSLYFGWYSVDTVCSKYSVVSLTGISINTATTINPPNASILLNGKDNEIIENSLKIFVKPGKTIQIQYKINRKMEERQETQKAADILMGYTSFGEFILGP